jgi:hypothetical protein
MPNLVTITDVSLGTIMGERDKFLAEREEYRLKWKAEREEAEYWRRAAEDAQSALNRIAKIAVSIHASKRM